MGEMAVERWLGRLLVEEAGFTLEEASAAAKANARFLDRFSLVSAISTAVVARATPRLPGGREWWMKQGERARHAVLDGNVGEAEAQVAELLAESAPDEWDPNWPEDKRSLALLREGANVGDEFVVGNGEGMRGRIRVEDVMAS